MFGRNRACPKDEAREGQIGRIVCVDGTLHPGAPGARWRSTARVTAVIRAALPATRPRSSREACVTGAALTRPDSERTSILAMDRISTSKARKDFRNVIRQASSGGKRVKITHYGKTLVGLVSAKDLATLEDCETDRPRRAAKKSPRRR